MLLVKMVLKTWSKIGPPSTMARHHKQFPPTLQQACRQVKLTPHVFIDIPMNNF